MSLEDRTNERIELSQHRPFFDGDSHGPYLEVDVDQDSSFVPSAWAYLMVVDREHDADTIKLTYEEAGLLHDRLGLILGRQRSPDQPILDTPIPTERTPE